MRPICINPGCGAYTVPSHGRVGQLGVRYRVHCGPCHKNSYDPANYSLKPGVTRYKKDICSNLNGGLGFPCVIDWAIAAQADLRISTEVDHINRNPNDNRPENLQELCSICHKEKGKRQGDYNGWANYREAA